MRYLVRQQWRLTLPSHSRDRRLLASLEPPAGVPASLRSEAFRSTSTFWKGKPMETDEFDLDISVLESGDGPASLIVLTDDGCGSSCPSACATNVV